MTTDITTSDTKMSLQEIALQQIEITKQVYKLSPHRMFAEYNGEKENVKNYNGRQLLEMLQNADDASRDADESNRKVLVRLEGDFLVIANTGYPFSEEGLNSIFLSHLSPKEVMEKQIGKKGLGFRSILSWANEVTIKSSGLCVAFSERHSQAVLDDLLTDHNFKQKFDQLSHGLTLPIATLVCPNVSEAFIHPFPGMELYDTVIQIELNQLAKPELLKQINNDLDGEVLLFLNNLERIVLDIDGDVSEFHKLKNAQNTKCSITHTTALKTEQKEWNMFSLSGKFVHLNKGYELGIAWQDGFEHNKDVLYSYFRTKVNVQCKGIIHGSFELNADRNLIIKDDPGYNEALLNLIPDLLCGAAEAIASNGEASYKPIEILQVDLSTVSNLVAPHVIKSAIIDQAKSKYIFPNITGSYMCWSGDKHPVYFREDIFARYLSPEHFPDLLLHTVDSSVVQFLEALKYVTYEIPEVIDDLSSLRESIPSTEYAGIISILHKYVKDTLKIYNCQLFYDSGYQLFNFKQPIFFPSENNYVLPASIGVQVMSKDLAHELLAATDSRTYAEVAGKLQHFRLREFNFKEVAELLIRHYNETDSTEDIIEFHRYLFMLFQVEKPEAHWSGTDVYFLSKKGKRTHAKKLYFGKEYNNPLVEDIYSYDKSKLLASLHKHRIDDVVKTEWTRYCEWLGVAKLPRLVSLRAGSDYADYVMRNFDYKNRIGDRSFKNGYKDFIDEHTQGFGGIYVRSIDDLSGILNHNSPERILQLLSEHPTIQGYVEKDIEPHDSQINFGFSYSKNTRTISGGLMKSFLKWTIKYHPWLQTESGVLSAPDRCCSAAYITDDFHGLVERPKLDYDVLRTKGINREKADYLLSTVGVHKGISTFSTSMLYSILLNLQKMDPAGKKTKTIYNQIAVNYDDRQLDKLDKTDSNYLKFHNEGQVFCNDGSFYPINNVHYVNDKRYGDTIVKEFNTIAIDRRRGKEKIGELFGVKPLEGLSLETEQSPREHPISAQFEKEMELFKPFVYVLRKDVDAGSEKSRIKDLKFKLVSDIHISMNRDGVINSLPLSNYDYLYVRERNLVYLKAAIPYASVNELREDVLFCSAVAEVFSGVLDVDVLRQQIRELFSKTPPSREALLETEFDDKSVQRLYEARRILGIVNDPKIDFWRSFSACLSKRKRIDGNLTDATLLETLMSVFPKLATGIRSAFEEINYENLNEEHSLREVMQLLKLSGISISKFNEHIYPTLDVSGIYDLEFKREKSNQKDKFKTLLYHACINGDIACEEFIGKINRYDSLTPNVVNELDFDVFEDLNSQTRGQFGVDLTLDSQPCDLAMIYQNNINFLQHAASDHCSDSLLFQFIRESRRIDSLLYFEAKSSDIFLALLNWLKKNTPESGGSPEPLKGKRVTIGGAVVTFESYKQLLDQLEQIITEDTLNAFADVEIHTKRKDQKKKANSNGSAPKFGHGSKSKELADEIGFMGEFITLKYLLKQAEPGTVRWVSEYAKECGYNLDGKDGWGYDFEYIPKGKKRPRYVEVKSVGKDNSFHMSSNEVKTGEQYKNYYDLFLIRNMDDFTQTRIEKIRDLFDYPAGETFTENDRFTVLNDNFIIRFNTQ